MLPSTTPGSSSAPERTELRREQDEIGRRCARRGSALFTGASALHLVALAPADLVRTLPVLALLAAATVVLSWRRGRPSTSAAPIVVAAVLGLTALALFAVSDVDARLSAVLGSLTMLASMALATPLLALGASRRLPLIAVAALAPVLVLSTVAALSSGRAFFVGLAVVIGWAGAFGIARWVAASVARADEGTRRLLTAHAAERRSSEDEARRRQDARLLHDTILATLTLVAHRGEGVPAETLRERAAADLELLRALDGPLPPSAPGSGARLPDGFATVGRRFRALGLEISWHLGEGDVAPDALAVLVGATGECLENVRRHSGVRAVDVTVEHGAGGVRVAVSDAGAGFDPAAVPVDRLGLAESVRGRLESVGGAARVFSAPGAGTTVLMSVPR